MKRRIFAAIAAVFLAGIGAVLLYSYVNSADARAMAKLDTADVLVATKVIPAGTSGSNLAPFVALKHLPQVAVVDGALTSASDVADLEVTTDLQIGEQVLASRFAPPNTDVTGTIDVPSDFQRFTVSLGPVRVIGANIKAGDKVALFVSADLKGSATRLAFRDVLVADVQGVPAPTGEDAAAVPAGDVMLTLAMTPKLAAQVIWSVENARIYMALEPKDGDHTSKPVVRLKTIFK